ILIFLILLYKAEAQSVSALADSKKADSLYEIGAYNMAIPYFKEIRNFIKIAKSYEAIGNNSEAERYFQKALSEHGDNPRISFEYAILLSKLSRYKRADSILQNLQLRFANNPNFVYERGLIREAQNDSTAIEFFRQAYKIDANNINANYKIARNYIENREFQEATSFIEKGLTLEKNSSRFLTLRALNEFYTKEFHEAIASYSQLIFRGESYVSLHENLAKSYSQTNQFEKALEQYKILLQQFDDQKPKWHHEVAILYRAMRAYNK